jgi:2-polyprenyl-6-hydroxyphenyl methylase / 3-demethylubiquinone-9 3-methyltransferase
MSADLRPRNDPRQYDDLADHWWRTDGAFAALHWLAEARSRHIPPAPRPGALLVDVACGGGLMHGRIPHGYHHLGIDLVASALRTARTHGLSRVAQGDITRLPLPDGCADVVLAGEILEHVTDLPAAVAETARVLAPGGTVVIDTINATRWARFSLVTVGERLPGGPPRNCHDPELFVPPRRLQALYARHGIDLGFTGLRFSVPGYAAFLAGRRRRVRMLPTRSLAAVYQAVGRKTGTRA